MKIYLARHGQSQWQVERSENWDTSLTVIGHEQAKRMGQWLADHQMIDNGSRIEIASLYASPYRRTQETADYTANALHLPLFTQQDLSEADFHVAEHLPQTVTPLQAYPAYEASAIYAAFKSQAQAALQGLVEQVEASGGSVLAVTHGGLIKTVLRLVVGSDTICFRLYNTGLNLIEWRRGRWHLVYLNLWDHLPTELRTW
jgi:broad specificity phosphatase PhoE